MCSFYIYSIFIIFCIMIYFTVKTKLKRQKENDKIAPCSVDRRRGQRDAGEKPCVSTEQRKPQGLMEAAMEGKDIKVRPAETTVSGTKGGFVNVNTAKCCQPVASEFSVGMKADK